MPVKRAIRNIRKVGINVAASRKGSKWASNEDLATPLKIIAGIAK